jgi:hypothetical protein
MNTQQVVHGDGSESLLPGVSRLVVSQSDLVGGNVQRFLTGALDSTRSTSRLTNGLESLDGLCLHVTNCRLLQLRILLSATVITWLEYFTTIYRVQIFL